MAVEWLAFAKWLGPKAVITAVRRFRAYASWKFLKRMKLVGNVKYSQVGWKYYSWTTTAGGTARVERQGLFLRVRVLNPPSSEAPKDVALTVVSVGECSPGMTVFRRIRQAEYPKPVVWSYSADLKKPGLTKLATLAEPEKFADLAVVHDPEGSFRGIELALLTEPEPRDNSHRFPPGDYRFGLVLTAANKAPIRVTADVALLGEWSEGHPDRVVVYSLRDGEPEYA